LPARHRWGCKAAIQGAAPHRRIRRRDQGRAVGDESASRNRKFGSTPSSGESTNFRFLSKRRPLMFVARNPCPSGRESATSSATPMPSISVAHLDCRGHQKGAICPELTFHGLLSTGGLYTHDGTLPGRRETRRRRAHVGQSAVGREWAFERVRNWMEDPNASRLLWIVGAPGVGKSALAVC
jgi:hypothetical protein